MIVVPTLYLRDGAIPEVGPGWSPRSASHRRPRLICLRSPARTSGSSCSLPPLRC